MKNKKMLGTALAGLAFVALALTVIYFYPGQKSPAEISQPEIQPTSTITSPEETAEKPAELLKMSYITVKVYDPVFVAKDAGFFEKNGLDVEILFSTSGPTNMGAVSGGEIEAGQGAIAAGINANAAGLPILFVVDMQTAFEDRPIMTYYALKDSEVNGFADFAGRAVAVNTMKAAIHYSALNALLPLGIADEDVDWRVIPFPDMTNALLTGQVDVIAFPEPYQTNLVKNYGDQVKVVGTDYEAFGGQRGSSLIFVNRVWAQNNPETATAFVTAIAEAENWINASEENRLQAAEIVSKYTDIPLEVLTEIRFPYTENGIISLDDGQAWIDFLKLYGDLKVDWMTPERFMTNEYNDLLE